MTSTSTLVFDLDPGAGVPNEFVVESALRMRDLLADVGLKTWPKLTGGKGLHVMAPLARKLTHDAAHAYARRLAQRLAKSYLRNGRGTIAVGAYSPRAREGFPIAAPVTWKQVEHGIKPDAFTIYRPGKPAAVKLLPRERE